MTYTVESVRQLFDEMREKTKDNPHYGSEVEPLFDENGKFSKDNWNSGQDIIRSKLFESDLIDTGNTFRVTGVFDPEGNEVIISAAIFHEDEEWSVVINIIGVDLYLFESYMIQWYKSRGSTEAIYRGNRHITIEAYTDLLNILERFNFYDKDNWHQVNFMKRLPDPDEK